MHQAIHCFFISNSIISISQEMSLVHLLVPRLPIVDNFISHSLLKRPSHTLVTPTTGLSLLFLLFCPHSAFSSHWIPTQTKTPQHTSCILLPSQCNVAHSYLQAITYWMQDWEDLITLAFLFRCVCLHSPITCNNIPFLISYLSSGLELDSSQLSRRPISI